MREALRHHQPLAPASGAAVPERERGGLAVPAPRPVEASVEALQRSEFVGYPKWVKQTSEFTI